MSKEFIKWLIPHINKDFYNIETVKRGKEYTLTIYPLALNRGLTELKRKANVELVSSDNCVYVYSIKKLK
jgi:hypothetical protein